MRGISWRVLLWLLGLESRGPGSSRFREEVERRPGEAWGEDKVQGVEGVPYLKRFSE